MIIIARSMMTGRPSYECFEGYLSPTGKMFVVTREISGYGRRVNATSIVARDITEEQWRLFRDFVERNRQLERDIARSMYEKEERLLKGMNGEGECDVEEGISS